MSIIAIFPPFQYLLSGMLIVIFGDVPELEIKSFIELTAILILSIKLSFSETISVIAVKLSLSGINKVFNKSLNNSIIFLPKKLSLKGLI